MSNNPAEGWYPDPDGTTSRLRFWDGTQWTDDYHQDEAAVDIQTGVGDSGAAPEPHIDSITDSQSGAHVEPAASDLVDSDIDDVTEIAERRTPNPEPSSAGFARPATALPDSDIDGAAIDTSRLKDASIPDNVSEPEAVVAPSAEPKVVGDPLPNYDADLVWFGVHPNTTVAADNAFKYFVRSLFTRRIFSLGRARRAEYISTVGLTLLLNFLLLVVLTSASFSGALMDGYLFLFRIFAIVSLVACVTVTIRRFRDASPYPGLIWFLLFGLYYLLYVLIFVDSSYRRHKVASEKYPVLKQMGQYRNPSGTGTDPTRQEAFLRYTDHSGRLVES